MPSSKRRTGTPTKRAWSCWLKPCWASSLAGRKTQTMKCWRSSRDLNWWACVTTPCWIGPSRWTTRGRLSRSSPATLSPRKTARASCTPPPRSGRTTHGWPRTLASRPCWSTTATATACRWWICKDGSGWGRLPAATSRRNSTRTPPKTPNPLTSKLPSCSKSVARRSRWRSTSTATRTAGAPTSPFCTTRWIHGSSVPRKRRRGCRS